MNDTTSMNVAQYIEQRLEAEISWYSKKSAHCQSRYRMHNIIGIVGAALIPLLSGLGTSVPGNTWIIGTLGMVVAISTAVSNLLKYHESWIQYRSTCEALKREKYLFMTKVAPYDTADAFATLVQRAEGLMSSEGAAWAQIVQADKKQSRPD